MARRHPAALISGLALLAVGVATGLASVYADTRAGCAAWVAVALVATFAAGLLVAHRPSTARSERQVVGTNGPAARPSPVR